MIAKTSGEKDSTIRSSVIVEISIWSLQGADPGFMYVVFRCRREDLSRQQLSNLAMALSRKIINLEGLAALLVGKCSFPRSVCGSFVKPDAKVAPRQSVWWPLSERSKY